MKQENQQMLYDVVIVGGGPAGLSAALALGRARKRVLLCDAGPRRNATAEHMYNFVTRDGAVPTEFRRIGREQLARYENVEVRDVGVDEIGGVKGAFEVRLAEGNVRARRILLATGMIDELPGIDGFSALWGKSIFQCPYCHGWEVQGRRFGVIAANPETLEFALLVRGWSGHVVGLTDGKFAIPAELRTALTRAGVALDERPIARLAGGDQPLAVHFVAGPPLQLDALFARPPQRQVPIVQSLGLALDPAGYVQIDELRRETSRAGIYAGGDLITPVQGAVIAAAAGMLTAAKLNHALTLELAGQGALP
jgi:thioredoxin reductase